MSVLQNFKKPTPYKWRKIGYTLLLASTSLAGYLEMFTEDSLYKKYIVGFIVVTGFLGKFITDLFKEDNAQAS